MKALWVALALLGAAPYSQVEPLPAPAALDPAKVALGKRLFSDTLLSGDRSMSCATCHPLDQGGADHKQFSTKVGGKPMAVNTPTVFNVGLNFKQFWGGRVETIEEVSDIVIAGTMATPWDTVLERLRADPTYARDFAAAFGGLSREAVNAALADFQRALIPRDSPFDRYLKGDGLALSPLALQGWRLFQDYGCISCHQGRAIGGNMFQRFGVMGDYFKQRGNIVEADWGHFNASKKEKDRFLFKVPSLRNVAQTAPYFHDGTALTLEMAIETMGEYQLGRPLEGVEIKALGAFLESLTGQLPEAAK